MLFILSYITTQSPTPQILYSPIEQEEFDGLNFYRGGLDILEAAFGWSTSGSVLVNNIQV